MPTKNRLWINQAQLSGWRINVPRKHCLSPKGWRRAYVLKKTLSAILTPSKIRRDYAYVSILARCVLQRSIYLKHLIREWQSKRPNYQELCGKHWKKKDASAVKYIKTNLYPDKRSTFFDTLSSLQVLCFLWRFDSLVWSLYVSSQSVSSLVREHIMWQTRPL